MRTDVHKLYCQDRFSLTNITFCWVCVVMDPQSGGFKGLSVTILMGSNSYVGCSWCTGPNELMRML